MLCSLGITSSPKVPWVSNWDGKSLNKNGTYFTGFWSFHPIANRLLTSWPPPSQVRTKWRWGLSSYLKWGELVLAMVGSELAMGRNLHKAGETFRNHVQITCPNFVMLPTLRNVKITVYSQSAFLGWQLHQPWRELVKSNWTKEDKETSSGTWWQLDGCRCWWRLWFCSGDPTPQKGILCKCNHLL